jgi:hypothetical protein
MGAHGGGDGELNLNLALLWDDRVKRNVAAPLSVCGVQLLIFI